MSVEKYGNLSDDELRGVIARRSRELVMGLIDDHPLHAGHLLEHCLLMDKLHESDKNYDDKLDAVTISAVRRSCVEKEAIRVKFFHELHFFPAKTVSESANCAEGCRMLIKAWRLICDKLCTTLPFHQREEYLIANLCGDYPDQSIGSPDSQIVYRLLRISQKRYDKPEYHKLYDISSEFAQKIVDRINKEISQQEFPLVFNAARRIYENCQNLFRNDPSFKWDLYSEHVASKNDNKVPRLLYREIRLFVARKLRDLRTRLRHFEILESQAPVDIRLTKDDMAQVNFFQKRSESLSKRLKDNSTTLRSIGVMVSLDRKPGREIATISEMSHNPPVARAPIPKPPKKAQSTGAEQGDSFNPNQPEIVNPCDSFVPPVDKAELNRSDRYKPISPDFAKEQLQELFAGPKRNEPRLDYQQRLNVFHSFYDSLQRKSHRMTVADRAMSKNDLKKSQSWEVADGQVKASDFGPGDVELAGPLHEHFQDKNDRDYVAEQREQIHQERANLKRLTDATDDARFRLEKEKQKKKPKKPETDDKQRK